MLAKESIEKIQMKSTVPNELNEKHQFNDALWTMIPNLNEFLQSASNDQDPEL